MQNNNTPLSNELPSMVKLIKSTILAIVMAGIILVTVVLPAEYGIDPTGIGNMIGLLKMGEIKVSLAQEAESESEAGKLQETSPIDSSAAKPKSNVNIRSDQMTISLIPNQGKEIKLTMLKAAKVNYLWFTNGGKASFDAHADSKALEINYHSYEKGKLERSEGVLEAAFDGNHGWFWRNRTDKDMTVTLQVEGAYSDIFEIK